MIDPDPREERQPLDEDPLFHAPPLGRSRDGLTSADHDAVLYGNGEGRTRPAPPPRGKS